MPPKMRPHLKNAYPYPPGRPIEEVQREYGLKSVVKLASNENPLGPSPKAVKAMKRAAKESHLYPDGGGYYLRRALAEKHMIQPEQIILGAGSDDLTTFIAQCYWGPGKNIVTSAPSFIRYEQNAIIAAGAVKRVPMKNWRYYIQSLVGAKI